MLDEDEFKYALSLRGTGNLWKQQFEPVLADFERLTGTRETNINAFYHHVVSLYGPPCSKCGKPLRTSKAKFCGACMHPVAERLNDSLDF